MDHLLLRRVSWLALLFLWIQNNVMAAKHGNTLDKRDPPIPEPSSIPTSTLVTSTTALAGMTFGATPAPTMAPALTPTNDNPFAGKPTFANVSNVPPVSLTWVDPLPNTVMPPLYKIGESNVTFEWTVDPILLKVQPESLTLAMVNPQQQTFTLSVMPGTATSAMWNLAEAASSSALMVGRYTAWVYDQRGPTAYPRPGWLSPNTRLTIALYSTEPYADRTDPFFCVTCYLGSASRPQAAFGPLALAFGVSLLTSIMTLWIVC